MRHLFRDHSNGLHYRGAGDSHTDRHNSHRQHHHQHQHPHHRKGSELSSDWPTLYLGAKLAYWSGLCYLPYETVCRTLQAEGLQLVAYGRTSYTCWYVADGCVDFDVLCHRAFPQRPTSPTRSTPSPPQSQRQQHPHHPPASASAPAARDTARRASGSWPPASSQSAAAAAAVSPGPWHPEPTTQPRGDDRLPGAAGPAGCPTDAGYSGARPEAAATAAGTESGAHGSSPLVPGTRCRFIFLRGFQLGAHDGNTLSLSASLATFWPTPLVSPAAAAAAVPQATSDQSLHGGRTETSLGNGGTTSTATSTSTSNDGRSDTKHSPEAASRSSPSSISFASLLSFASSRARAGVGASADLAAANGVGAVATTTAGKTRGGSTGAAGTMDSGVAPGRAGAGGEEHLVAHSGVAALARELMPVLLPHIRDAAAAGATHIVFAGHSLGGSLAKLLWAMCLLQGHSSPAATSCHTFGSPPVVAHSSGGGGARVLRLLRAPPASVLNWVLEHDPIPRAMLTADPYFAAARAAVPGLGALLALRGAVLGEGAALSSGRFLYETVGEVMLLRWAEKGGCEVVPVSEAEADSLLRIALDQALTAPVRTLQHWLDHHHASYHHDLEAAALATCRRAARGQQR